MEKLFEQLPKIIEEAAKSPLGLLALMIIALSLLAFFFFREASARTRVGIFLVLFAGCAVFAWAIFRVGFFIQEDQANQPPSGKIVALQNVPALPADVPTDNAELRELRTVYWMRALFGNARIIIDRGSDKGTKQGDYFVVVRSREINDADRKILGTTEDEEAWIEVVEARPKLSVGQLETVATIGWEAAQQRIDKYRDSGALQRYPELAAPVAVGEKVLQIAREEKAWWDDLDKTIQKLWPNDDQQLADEEKKSRYLAVVASLDEYLQDHPNSYFAEKALFRKGNAQYDLHQYSASIDTFNLFLKRYPFHVSAPGAQEAIDRAREAQLNEARKAP